MKYNVEFILGGHTSPSPNHWTTREFPNVQSKKMIQVNLFIKQKQNIDFENFGYQKKKKKENFGYQRAKVER